MIRLVILIQGLAFLNQRVPGANNSSVYLKLSTQLVAKLKPDLVQLKHERFLAHSEVLPFSGPSSQSTATEVYEIYPDPLTGSKALMKTKRSANPGSLAEGTQQNQLSKI